MRNRLDYQNFNEFKKLLAYQDDIENIQSYCDYSISHFYNDICLILKKDEFYQKQIFLKKVMLFYISLNIYSLETKQIFNRFLKKTIYREIICMIKKLINLNR
jgi:hypothetical protein